MDEATKKQAATGETPATDSQPAHATAPAAVEQQHAHHVATAFSWLLQHLPEIARVAVSAGVKMSPQAQAVAAGVILFEEARKGNAATNS